MHLRAPALGRETSAIVWGVGLGFYVWVFALAVGVTMAVSVIAAILSAAVVFFAVLLFGDDARR